MFSDFDFNLLDDPSFKEDSVREELIAPMLKDLGYSSSPPNQILRSVALKHPYVYIGTKKHPVNIIPDYLLKRSRRTFLVIDAKAPNEEIHHGKNVEQAYSYAIHRDVRANFYALCNRREFVLYHINRWPKVLSFSMKEIDSIRGLLVRLIGTESEFKKVAIKPDFGLHLLKLGLALDRNLKKISQVFPVLDVDFVSRIDELSYSFSSHLEMDGIVYLATFDFSKELLSDFLTGFEPKVVVPEVTRMLTKYPFKWHFTLESPGFVGLACQISDGVHENDGESYCPFVVTKFF
jgi:hypothetical protein